MSIQEKQHCFKESFPYFQCAACGCIQISTIPANIEKYYPHDYYSLDVEEGTNYLNQRLPFFKKVQTDYLLYRKNPFLGKLFTVGYKPPDYLRWLQHLKLQSGDRVLDIGCGGGLLLKRFYQLGYRNLTGADPFIQQDYFFTDDFRIYKKDPLRLPESEKFDCIMMHHSFEHMEHGKEVLQKVRNLLAPGGKLLIRIPVVSDVLLKKYGVNVVSLDAPRHFYIHSTTSMNLLCREANLKIDKIEYDAEAFSFWASEQYVKDICLSDERSYSRSRKRSIFSKKDIKRFKKEIKTLNENGESDNAAFYISASE